MASTGSYWDVVELVWEVINIYDSPEEFLRTFNAATEKQGMLFAAHFTTSEVCNGGFDQYFYNSTGVLAPEAVRGFEAIGMPGIAALVKEAMDRVAVPFTRDRDVRIDLLDEKELEFDDLDERFFELITSENGGFETAADAYANAEA